MLSNINKDDKRGYKSAEPLMNQLDEALSAIEIEENKWMRAGTGLLKVCKNNHTIINKGKNKEVQLRM